MFSSCLLGLPEEGRSSEANLAQEIMPSNAATCTFDPIFCSSPSTPQIGVVHGPISCSDCKVLLLARQDSVLVQWIFDTFIPFFEVKQAPGTAAG